MVCRTRPGVSSELSKSPGSSSSSSSTYGRSRGTDDLPIGRRRQIRCHRRTYDIAAHKPFGRKFERSVWNECQTGGTWLKAGTSLHDTLQIGASRHGRASGSNRTTSSTTDEISTRDRRRSFWFTINQQPFEHAPENTVNTEDPTSPSSSIDEKHCGPQGPFACSFKSTFVI